MKARILVVDDAATVRMYHRKVLADAGWQTEEAMNGVEALERLKQSSEAHGFDLLIVDVNMPQMDGYRLVQLMRGDAELSQPPVLMVSTEAQSADSRRAFEAGANSYLIKPAQPQDLVMAVALLLGDVQAVQSFLSKSVL